MRRLFFLFLLGISLTAGAQTASEYDMKAAYLYNFARFTEWPASERANFNLCVLGDEELGQALRKYEERRINDQRVVIARLNTMTPIRQCNLLFVGAAELPNLAKINAHLGDLPVLTVVDRPAAAPVGIVMALESERLVFDLNLEHAQRSRLKHHPSVLRLARYVRKAP